MRRQNERRGERTASEKDQVKEITYEGLEDAQKNVRFRGKRGGVNTNIRSDEGDQHKWSRTCGKEEGEAQVIHRSLLNPKFSKDWRGAESTTIVDRKGEGRDIRIAIIYLPRWLQSWRPGSLTIRTIFSRMCIRAWP
jgi:hypothetical protein